MENDLRPWKPGGFAAALPGALLCFLQRRCFFAKNNGILGETGFLT